MAWGGAAALSAIFSRVALDGRAIVSGVTRRLGNGNRGIVTAGGYLPSLGELLFLPGDEW
ncbi:MAG: hypothetical protein ACRDNW_26025 [Trebonia sp.]